ncbi:hypothetical protein [Pseudoalteromonas sp. AC163]|uniref:hypothetical protein n=1 Tax=Pseudoalteromonas sp. AC163 TaxID=1055790 RepID=UPI00041C2494|nr:hypothetical protein [Pseudoalteromonas sp. AC163]
MDIFNIKKIAKLERQLSLKEAQCSSLKSDLAFLERENDKLKARLGENPKVATRVKSSEPTFITGSKTPSRPLSNTSTSSNRLQTEGSSVAVAAGVLANAVLNDHSDFSSD